MTDLEKLARAFHEAYETLAPSLGYVTRAETREFDPNSANGRLMMAVCEVVLGEEGRRIRSAGRIEGLKEAAGIASKGWWPAASDIRAPASKSWRVRNEQG